MIFNSERVVEAIEEGKIVRVREDYARREQLPIIKNNSGSGQTSIMREREPKPEEKVRSKRVLLEEYRKPLHWEKNKVINELVSHFNWDIVKKRRELNLGRKQFAEAMGEKEETIKKLEFGILPADDFVLINKVQNYLKINLRKDQQNFNESFRAKAESTLEKQEISDSEIIDEDIELI